TKRKNRSSDPMTTARTVVSGRRRRTLLPEAAATALEAGFTALRVRPGDGDDTPAGKEEQRDDGDHERRAAAVAREGELVVRLARPLRDRRQERGGEPDGDAGQ